MAGATVLIIQALFSLAMEALDSEGWARRDWDGCEGETGRSRTWVVTLEAEILSPNLVGALRLPKHLSSSVRPWVSFAFS